MRRDEAKDEMRDGVLWPAGLLVNELTLREHVGRLKKGEMNHAVARRCGYAESEILDVLGPDPEKKGAR